MCCCGGDAGVPAETSLRPGEGKNLGVDVESWMEEKGCHHRVGELSCVGVGPEGLLLPSW